MRDFFNLQQNETTVRTEMSAGVTTFLTMAYIIFVQPAVLSGSMFGMDTGMSQTALVTATCLSAAFATALMGGYAKLPIAQAPGMGQNFFFVFTVLPAAGALAAVSDGHTTAWQVAMGTVFISGVLFLALSLTPFRHRLLQSISTSMKNSMAAGIGLFIAFIGFQNAGLIQANPGTLVQLNGHFASPDLIVFFFGLFLITALHTRQVKGAILWGILGATALASVLKLTLPLLPMAIQNSEIVSQSLLVTRWELTGKIFSAPPSLAPIFMKMDFVYSFSITMVPFIVVFLFMDVFDTMGTLVGVIEQTEFLKQRQGNKIEKAMLSDSVGTVVGAALGTSTVTSYIESASGVQQGGRTGLTALTTAALFLVAPVLTPLIGMVGTYAPITAPALVIVGAMMLQNVTKIDWNDFSEAIPAFLILTGIPLTYSIADGLALGFISYPLIKLLAGRQRELTGLMTIMSLLLLMYFLVLRSHLA